VSGCSKRDSTMAGKAAGHTSRHRGRGVGRRWRKCGDNRRCRGFVKGYLVHLLDVGGERVSAVPQDDLLQEHEGALVVHVLPHLRQGKEHPCVSRRMEVGHTSNMTMLLA